jgi:transcriptional regulator with XRE-family HTH domain
MPTVDPNVLKKARKESGMSQSQLAKNLDISQTQVSRYEKNPDSIPAGLFSRWTSMFGLSPADVLQVSSENSLQADPGEPYADFHRDLDLLSRYVDMQASSGALEHLSVEAEEIGGHIPGPSELKDRAEDLRRKPNVMTAGGFDTGKSYLANALMGKEVLPTSYQPATRVITVVRHVDDRPDWQDEDVWLFDKDLWTKGGETRIDISRLSEKSCEEHRVLAGSHDLLGRYGVHRSEPTEKVKRKLEQAHSAVVYVDAPILKACNLVDLPGFGDRPTDAEGSGDTGQKSADQKKAESALPFADVILYASRISGHLSGKDLARISTLLQRVPAPESESDDFPTLGSLFLVATHADRNVSDSQKDNIKKKATRRLHRYLESGVLARYEERSGREVTVDDLRAQWFPFWAENERRSRPLVSRVEEILGKCLPEIRIKQGRRELNSLKEEVRGRCENGVRLYHEAAEESATQQQKVKELKERASERKEELRQEREDIYNLIDMLEQKSLSRKKTVFQHVLQEDKIEEMIRRNFDDKSEAKDSAPALVVEEIESRIENEIEPLNDELTESVKGYLSSFEELSVQADEEDQIAIPFDAQGTFAGGLAGAGAAGGLAAWASQLGPLGGYVIVSQGVGALSALGISISGGAAAASAWVAAMGGPVALGAAVAGVTGLAGWRLLSQDWQERLATKIVKYYEDEELEEEFKDGIESYWDDTREAFEAGANAVEEEFQNHLDRLERLGEKEEKAHRLAERFEEARDFYAGMPV